MTATTPALNLPFAQSSDPRGAGAQAIQQLAQATEDAILGSYAIRNTAGWGSVAPNTATDAPLGTPDAKSAHWSTNGTIWTYTGPTRAHLIAACVTIGVTDGVVSPDLITSAALVINGTVTAASSDQRVQTGSNLTGILTHPLVAVAILGTGATVRVRATSGRAAAVSGSLSVHSIGPRAAS